MKFIPNTNNQYMFNSNGDVLSLKSNKYLKHPNGMYSVIFNHGRRNIRIDALENLYLFLSTKSKQINFASNYFITEDGDVYSTITNCWVQPFYDKDGYKRIAIVCDDGVRRKFRLARLVALTYIDNPLNLPIVNHKDENKQNDNYLNLEWCTHSYNANYSMPWLKRRRNSNGAFI